MRYITLLVITMLILMMFGCSKQAEKLTAVDMNTLKVPADFNYDTTRPVEVRIWGLYQQTVKINDLNGNTLMKGLLNPVQAFETKLTLPYTIKQVKIIYGNETATVRVSSLNKIEYSFLPSY